MRLIKKYEGCSLKAYKCPAGVLTIGWGNTYYEDGSRVSVNDVITQQRADNILKWYCEDEITIPKGFGSGQNEAMQSLIYNIGQGAFDRSSLKKHIINRNLKGIFNNWNWINANGKALRGLAKRRADELRLFVSEKI